MNVNVELINHAIYLFTTLVREKYPNIKFAVERDEKEDLFILYFDTGYREGYLEYCKHTDFYEVLGEYMNLCFWQLGIENVVTYFSPSKVVQLEEDRK